MGDKGWTSIHLTWGMVKVHHGIEIASAMDYSSPMDIEMGALDSLPIAGFIPMYCSLPSRGYCLIQRVDYNLLEERECLMHHQGA